MKYIKMLTGYVFGHDPVFRKKRRARLLKRMDWVLFIDSLEGLLNCASRRYSAKR